MSQKKSYVRPEGADWRDSYFTLDERYKQLQKTLNEKEKELQLAKVAERRASAASVSLSRSRASLRGRGRGRGSRGRRGSRDFADARAPSIASMTEREEEDSLMDQSPYSVAREAAPMPVNMEYLQVPSRAQPDAARAAAINEASMWGPESMLPDPSLIWGAEGSIQNYVAASALFHANEELRRKLDESTTIIKTLQHELSSSRTQSTNIQTKLDDCTQHMHQLVRERDLATQKYEMAKLTITDFERTLENRISEENKVKFSLESQVTELRSRLIAGADNNDLLSKDVRALLAETREKTGEVMSLRSKLALLESSYRSQKGTNENLLVELKSLNNQLVHERKKLIAYSRDVQSAALQQDRVKSLEERVQNLTDERNQIEREHVKLMSDFVGVTENGLRHAREEVKQDLKDWKEAADHWEEVAQLLYKDIAQRTQNHIKCRAECEEAKAQRDTSAIALRSTKEELSKALAKLRVVWPSHENDTIGLTEEEILSTFGVKNRFRVRVAKKKKATKDDDEITPAERKLGETEGDTAPALLEFSEGDNEEDDINRGDEGSEEKDMYEEVLVGLAYDPATKGERLRELHEANAGLAAEVAQLKLSNELLQTRIESLTGRRNAELRELEEKSRSLEKREVVGQQLLDKQLERVKFLETQVRSLRGYSVERGEALESISTNENVFELFLGQLVAQEVPPEIPVPEMFASIFCTTDFLLHETVTSQPITGLNGFFDTTISFRISMDALLLYYLQTRNLFVQLHRVRGEGEVEQMLQEGDEKPPSTDDRDGSSSDRTLRLAQTMYETIAEGQANLLDIILDETSRTADRPSLKGHIKFFNHSGRHIASLEFQLTARAPFSKEFCDLIDASFPDGIPLPQHALVGPPPTSSVEAGLKLPKKNHQGINDWISESSRASSERRKKRGSGIQIIPTAANLHSNYDTGSQLQHAARHTPGRDSTSDSYYNSSENSSERAKRRQLQEFAEAPAPPPPFRPTQSQPFQDQSYVPATPNPMADAPHEYSPSSIGQLPSPWTENALSPAGFTHLSPV